MNAVLRKILLSAPVRGIAPRFFKKAGKVLHLGLVFHSEMVQDNAVFDKLIEMSKSIPFRPVLCIMTPQNPYIKDDMKKRKITENQFTERIQTLAKSCDIGFHGHWCMKTPDGTMQNSPYNRNVETGIEKAGFVLTLNKPEEIEKQFRNEYNYFEKNGFKPGIYTAGWWHLNKTIVSLLDKHGFDIDCSIRHLQNDTFGKRYMTEQELPRRGKAFHLFPSKKIIELASISYLHMNWWTIIKDLYPVFRQKDGPLFAILPLHDYDLLDNFSKVKENIEFLSQIKNVRWSSINEMKETSAPTLPGGGGGFA